MTNEDKLREIFPKTIFLQHIEGDKITALVCSDEWLNAEYQEPTPKNDLGVDCISRADAIGSIAVECSAEKLDIDYAKFLMLRRAIKALPAVTPQAPTTKKDLEVDFKLKDYVSREAVRRIIKSQRTQEQMLNALNSLRNATECKAEDCINRDYTAKYVEEFANNEYVSQDEAETIYLIADGIRHIPSALPDVDDNNVGELTIHCKDCKFFEYDHFEDVFGVPLIVAHEVCTKWGDACKTNENGACFLAERKESEVKE